MITQEDVNSIGLSIGIKILKNNNKVIILNKLLPFYYYDNQDINDFLVQLNILLKKENLDSSEVNSLLIKRTLTEDLDKKEIIKKVKI